MRRALLTSLWALAGLAQGAGLGLPQSDVYGYTASAIAYSFSDISGSGSLVTGWSPSADDGSVLFNLPFNFRFYGAPYNKVSISSNGYLQFGSQSSFYGVNCLSANQDPRSIAALYWMDLNPGAGGTVHTEVQGLAGNRVAIVQFSNVPPSVGGGALTAQIRLYEADHSLEMAWADSSAGGAGADAVAGLRSGFDCPNRTSLPLSCLQALLPAGLAVRFTEPAGLPACGTPTFTASPTTSPTFSVSPTFSESPTATPSFSQSPTRTDSPTATATPSHTPSFTDSPTATQTPSATPTATLSPSFTVSPTATPTPTASPSSTASPTPPATATATPSASATASPSATRTSVVLTDAFGYKAVQAPLAWEDISGTGTPITGWAGGADDGSVLLDLPSGWLFRYYGADYSKVAVSTNGYLQFGASSSAFGHSCPAAGASPFGIAALFWMDLDPGNGGTVLWQVLGSAPNRRLVVQFDAVSDQAVSGALTAQAVLFEGSHALSLRYLSAASLGSGNAAAAGLRSLFDCPNRGGLALSCDTPLLLDGTQWDLSYPPSEPACGTPTSTPTPSHSPSPTASPTGTPTASPTATPSASPSGTFTVSPSPTVSPTASPSGTATASPTLSPSFSVSPTATLSPSFSVSPTATPTSTRTPTFSHSPTATPTATITLTGTISPTFSASPTVTETPTESPSSTASPSFSASPTETETATLSPSFSVSPTLTATGTATETATLSPSFSVSPTSTPSGTVTDSPTVTPTRSPSASASPTFTPSDTPTHSPTRSVTPTATPSGTRTATPSATPSFTDSPTSTDSPTRTASPTPTATLWPAASRPACAVLGAGDFTSVGTGTDSAGPSQPAGIAFDTRNPPFKVFVSDPGKHRILVWSDLGSLANGLAADAVIGQADFSAGAADRGGPLPSALGLNGPHGIAVDPNTGDLWVADTGNHRVLRFRPPFGVGTAVADRVLGQGGDFSAKLPHTGAANAQTLSAPMALSMDGSGRLAVADSGANRVLLFSDPGSSDVAAAAYGQGGSLSGSAPNAGGPVSATGLSFPAGVALAGTQLWVSDTFNHRVLRFGAGVPLSLTADTVLGQLSFSGASPNMGFAITGDQRLFAPAGLALDLGGRVVVADAGNNRVVSFEPPYDTQAELVYGQPNLGLSAPGTGQDLMDQPLGVAAWASVLAVADGDNNRILLYGCSGAIQVASATPTFTPTSTVTPTRSPTPTRSATPTRSMSNTRTPTLTNSPSPTLTNTPNPAFSPTDTPTLTETPTASPTATVTPTGTPVPSSTVTLTPLPTQTPYPLSRGPVLAWPNPAPRGGGRACVGFAPATDVRIELFDRLGQPVTVLDGASINGPGGFACWDLRNRAGSTVAPGLYYVRVLRDGQSVLGKLTVR